MNRRKKPDMEFLVRFASKKYCDENHKLQDREVAYMRSAKAAGANCELAFQMLDRQRNGWPIQRDGKIVIQRTIHPRKLVGAYPTSSAVVSTPDGVGKLEHKTGPTCKVREAKVRARQRAVVACSQAAHTVDQRRFYAHITAPYRKGGSMSSKVRKQVRRILCKADHLYSQGEISAAIAIFRGEL